MRFHQAVTFLGVEDALALAVESDEQGWDGIYVSDHMFYPRVMRSQYTYSSRADGLPFWEPETPWPDPWCLICAAAARTRHIEFSTGVYVAPARDIVTVAKQVATAASISGGRVNLGVGVGWCEEEFAATGQDFASRGKRLDDMIPALRALWQPGWVQYHGAYYDLPELRMEPVPPRPVPILGGGHSAPALRRAATLCDGWVAAGAYSAEEARQHLSALAEARRRAGREKEPFTIVLSLSGAPDIDLYRSFEEDHAVTDMLCAPWMRVRPDPSSSPEQMRRLRADASARFADEVIAKLR